MSPQEPFVNKDVESVENSQYETDTFKMRRISALCLVLITAGYILSHDNNKTIEIIMLGLASFMIGASLLQTYPKQK